MPVGQIIKLISGFYYVKTKTDEIIECRARGIFKFEKKKITPLVGDYVKYQKLNANQGIIVAIEPRFSELLRPPIANVTQVVIVCSIREPSFDFMWVDRLLVCSEKQNLKVMICVTKKDLTQDDKEIENISFIYKKIGYPIITTSLKKELGINELKRSLANEISVFAGPSGVGKSSLLHLLTGQSLKTAAISRKLGRGRHTTRVVELLSLSDQGFVADTPGFSQLFLKGIEAQDLGDLFPEIKQYAPFCKYRTCYHLDEPSCKVKEAVSKQDIYIGRYNHYLYFLSEIKGQNKRY